MAPRRWPSAHSNVKSHENVRAPLGNSACKVEEECGIHPSRCALRVGVFGGWLCPAHCTLLCLPAARKKVDFSSLSQDKQAGAMTAQFFLGLTLRPKRIKWQIIWFFTERYYIDDKSHVTRDREHPNPSPKASMFLSYTRDHLQHALGKEVSSRPAAASYVLGSLVTLAAVKCGLRLKRWSRDFRSARNMASKSQGCLDYLNADSEALGACRGNAA